MSSLAFVEELELEELHLVRDRATGLRAAVAIHDRTLGPARGGTRLRRYDSLEAVARDAGRLARAMSHKFAVHGLPYGGGKAVILQDEAGARDRALLEARLRAYGEFLNRLGGEFGTGPDYGIGAAEVAVLRSATDHAVGVHSHGLAGRATAAGVRVAIEAGLRAQGLDLAGARVVVQGVGAVGAHLARDLAARGARVAISDVDLERAAALARELGADLLDPASCLSAEADVLAPCATGDVLTSDSIPALRCRVVAGAANEQLAPPELEQAQRLSEAGIIYIPDFVANGGGAILLTGCGEEGRAEDLPRTEQRVAETVRQVCERAAASGCTHYEAAVALAEQRLRVDGVDRAGGEAYPLGS